MISTLRYVSCWSSGYTLSSYGLETKTKPILENKVHVSPILYLVIFSNLPSLSVFVSGTPFFSRYFNVLSLVVVAHFLLYIALVLFVSHQCYREIELNRTTPADRRLQCTHCIHQYHHWKSALYPIVLCNIACNIARVLTILFAPVSFLRNAI